MLTPRILLRSFYDHVQSPPRLKPPCDSRRRRPALGGTYTIGIAHRRLHRRRRNMEVGWLYTLGWYLYYLLTLWTLPGLDMATKVLRQKSYCLLRRWSGRNRYPKSSGPIAVKSL